MSHAASAAVSPAMRFSTPTMTRLQTTILCALAALALAAPAAAEGFRVGVADDSGKYAEDGGASFWSRLTGIGLREDRITVYWNADRPTEIVDRGFLDRSLPVAAARGVDIVFSVNIGKPTAISGDPSAAPQFAKFLQILARRYPQVHEFIVGNEVNVSRFWQPQFAANGTGVAGSAYENLLALGYDALKEVSPDITVIGLAVSSRGNDNAKATSNVSTSPVRFIHDVAAAYSASGRTRPLMDQLGFHIYPNVNTDAPAKGYAWPNAGAPNLDRIKQAFWDGFNGTAQPTFAEAGTGPALLALAPPALLKIDESAWQVGTEGLAGYMGAENVPTVDGGTQAQFYVDLIRRLSCDGAVTGIDFFHLIDEENRDRFQSGFFDIAWTARPVAAAVQAEIAQTGGRCAGAQAQWRHSTSVAGASADFGATSAKPKGQTWWGFEVRSEEETTFSAGLFRVSGPNGDVSRSLASARAGDKIFGTSGVTRAYLGSLIRFPEKKLEPGWYAYGVKLAATMNPARNALFAGKPFRVG